MTVCLYKGSTIPVVHISIAMIYRSAVLQIPAAELNMVGIRPWLGYVHADPYDPGFNKPMYPGSRQARFYQDVSLKVSNVYEYPLALYGL